MWRSIACSRRAVVWWSYRRVLPCQSRPLRKEFPRNVQADPPRFSGTIAVCGRRRVAGPRSCDSTRRRVVNEKEGSKRADCAWPVSESAAGVASTSTSSAATPTANWWRWSTWTRCTDIGGSTRSRSGLGGNPRTIATCERCSTTSRSTRSRSRRRIIGTRWRRSGPSRRANRSIAKSR